MLMKPKVQKSNQTNQLQSFLIYHIKDDIDFEKLQLFIDRLIEENREWKRRYIR